MNRYHFFVLLFFIDVLVGVLRVLTVARHFCLSQAACQKIIIIIIIINSRRQLRRSVSFSNHATSGYKFCVFIEQKTG